MGEKDASEQATQPVSLTPFLDNAKKRLYGKLGKTIYVDNPEYWATLAKRANIHLDDEPIDTSVAEDEMQWYSKIKQRYKGYLVKRKDDEKQFYDDLEREYRMEKEKNRQIAQDEEKMKRLEAFVKGLQGDNAVSVEEESEEEVEEDGEADSSVSEPEPEPEEEEEVEEEEESEEPDEEEDEETPQFDTHTDSGHEIVEILSSSEEEAQHEEEQVEEAEESIDEYDDSPEASENDQVERPAPSWRPQMLSTRTVNYGDSDSEEAEEESEEEEVESEEVESEEIEESEEEPEEESEEPEEESEELNEELDEESEELESEELETAEASADQFTEQPIDQVIDIPDHDEIEIDNDPTSWAQQIAQLTQEHNFEEPGSVSEHVVPDLMEVDHEDAASFKPSFDEIDPELFQTALEQTINTENNSIAPAEGENSHHEEFFSMLLEEDPEEKKEPPKKTKLRTFKPLQRPPSPPKKPVAPEKPKLNPSLLDMLSNSISIHNKKSAGSEMIDETKELAVEQVPEEEKKEPAEPEEETKEPEEVVEEEEIPQDAITESTEIGDLIEIPEPIIPDVESTEQFETAEAIESTEVADGDEKESIGALSESSMIDDNLEVDETTYATALYNETIHENLVEAADQTIYVNDSEEVHDLISETEDEVIEDVAPVDAPGEVANEETPIEETPVIEIAAETPEVAAVTEISNETPEIQVPSEAPAEEYEDNVVSNDEITVDETNQDQDTLVRKREHEDDDDENVVRKKVRRVLGLGLQKLRDVAERVHSSSSVEDHESERPFAAATLLQSLKDYVNEPLLAPENEGPVSDMDADEFVTVSQIVDEISAAEEAAVQAQAVAEPMEPVKAVEETERQSLLSRVTENLISTLTEDIVPPTTEDEVLQAEEPITTNNLFENERRQIVPLFKGAVNKALEKITEIQQRRAQTAVDKAEVEGADVEEPVEEPVEESLEEPEVDLKNVLPSEESEAQETILTALPSEEAEETILPSLPSDEEEAEETILPSEDTQDDEESTHTTSVLGLIKNLFEPLIHEPSIVNADQTQVISVAPDQTQQIHVDSDQTQKIVVDADVTQRIHVGRDADQTMKIVVKPEETKSSSASPEPAETSKTPFLSLGDIPKLGHQNLPTGTLGFKQRAQRRKAITEGMTRKRRRAAGEGTSRSRSRSPVRRDRAYRAPSIHADNGGSGISTRSGRVLSYGSDDDREPEREPEAHEPEDTLKELVDTAEEFVEQGTEIEEFGEVAEQKPEVKTAAKPKRMSRAMRDLIKEAEEFVEGPEGREGGEADDESEEADDESEEAEASAEPEAKQESSEPSREQTPVDKSIPETGASPGSFLGVRRQRLRNSPRKRRGGRTGFNGRSRRVRRS